MLKKVGFIGAFLLGIFTFSSVYSQDDCPTACPCDQACGECYCKYVRYEPRCNMINRCVEEQVPCTRRCCRYVPEYYNVQCCRYVPQYYTVQVQKCRYVPEYYNTLRCRQVPEYYDVQESKTCRKVVCEPSYTYVPRYYWKYECNNTCNDTSAPAPAAPAPASQCPGGGCSNAKCGK